MNIWLKQFMIQLIYTTINKFTLIILQNKKKKKIQIIKITIKP